MGSCIECRYFRTVRPPSQLFLAALGAVEGKVADALSKIVEDEQKVRVAEAEYKRAEATAERDLWMTRPLMSDFCGLKEPEGVYAIAEVKNRGGGCADFARGLE